MSVAEAMSALVHQQGPGGQRKDSVDVTHLEPGWALGQEATLALDIEQHQSLFLALLGFLV